MWCGDHKTSALQSSHSAIEKHRKRQAMVMLVTLFFNLSF